ncbi:OmpA family protein [Inmirania thermothiophila]|uniref:Outer membrane protein OmpA-like peptidoglycan-associated protein n=1 Tax=Inmirania thermothiophila TaxID=1750597 RepID=A0A3N1Y916_9GAMM|nr:OmpA family protein [Inmirania thermothiophila]ROR35041.1 outer membrane protein OmpA-like peptidoglycan-associated protein [Inmirania thermothiophila]
MRAILLAVLILAAAPARALQSVYEAPLDEAVWRGGGTPARCELVHQVPGWGRVRFVHEAGGGLRLRLEPAAAAPVRVALAAVPPEWRPGMMIEDLAETALAGRPAAAEVAGEAAGRLLARLEAGIYGLASYARGGDEVMVFLSAVRFADGLEAFRACEARLLPWSFAEVARREVRFDSGSAAPPPAARAALAPLARWAAADPEVRVRVEASADPRGDARANLALSRRRAEAVRTLLVALGVPAARIELVPRGEVAAPRPRWAAVRRAEVRLLR